MKKLIFCMCFCLLFAGVCISVQADEKTVAETQKAGEAKRSDETAKPLPGETGTQETDEQVEEFIKALVDKMAEAEPEKSREELQWKLFNDMTVKAYHDGQYQTGIAFAEKAYQYALKQFGKKHPSTLTSMNNLALLYELQGRYGEAEPLCKAALQLSENVLGKEHPDTLTSMNNLAGLYESQGRYGEAEPLYKAALQLRENVLGKEHP
ncbi:MAG: tetratricopeptide repeat protein, partial [Desulfobacterales bacterium]|nr:tetratricopeptide repeat protein [Desulfobacterales bacterium]